MHLGVYGAGYLGSIVSACLADFGTPVTCYDDDSRRVHQLAAGQVSFYEKNLQDLMRRNVRAGRLVHSTDLDSFAAKAQAIFLAQDSPRWVEDTALRLAELAPPETTMVILTPCPVGTAARIEARLQAMSSSVSLVTQPLFLTDGCAVEDFNWPDRIVLGTRSPAAVLALKQIYRPLVMRGVPVIVTRHETAELVREASTAYLAAKVAFINEMAALCEHVRADAVDLALALGLDKKIAPRCLQPGAAFGGPFAEQEMQSLAELAEGRGVPLRILAAAREVHSGLSEGVVDKISSMVSSVCGKEVGILGMAFKPHSSSVAGSASVALARRLATSGARVRAYDPAAMEEARLALDSTVRYCDTAYAAAEGADALVLATGWPEFRTLDFARIRRIVRQPVIVDTKNLLEGERLRSLGFRYVGVGRA